MFTHFICFPMIDKVRSVKNDIYIFEYGLK